MYALWYSVRLLGRIATVLTGLRTLASWLLAFDPWRARSCSEWDGGMTCGREILERVLVIEVLK